METRAVILAAGRGSRLASRTEEVPKALLPIEPRSMTDHAEHEQLTQHRMHLDRIAVAVFPGALPFMEVDDASEYRELREISYPRLLETDGQVRVETVS
jgi:choline kinase